MLATNKMAFKEWAVVCAALSAGCQTIILRKGGLNEGRDGFRVEHNEFWLLPTRFHQDVSAVVADAEPLWREALASQPPPGKFYVDLYAVVQEVFDLRELVVLERLADEHILSAETIRQRFNYRHPGLFVLAVRTFRVPQPYEVSDTSYIAGCKSWVELPESFGTAGVAPVLDDTEFASRVQTIKRLLMPR